MQRSTLLLEIMSSGYPCSLGYKKQRSILLRLPRVKFSFSKTFGPTTSFFDKAHHVTTDGDFWSVLYISFGHYVLQIRQFCLFTCPESENLYSSEKTVHYKQLLSFLIAEDNIKRVGVNSLHHLLLQPCSFVTCTEKALTLFKKCSRPLRERRPFRKLLQGEIFEDHFRVVRVLRFDQQML